MRPTSLILSIKSIILHKHHRYRQNDKLNVKLATGPPRTVISSPYSVHYRALIKSPVYRYNNLWLFWQCWREAEHSGGALEPLCSGLLFMWNLIPEVSVLVCNRCEELVVFSKTTTKTMSRTGKQLVRSSSALDTEYNAVRRRMSRLRVQQGQLPVADGNAYLSLSTFFCNSFVKYIILCTHKPIIFYTIKIY